MNAKRQPVSFGLISGAIKALRTPANVARFHKEIPRKNEKELKIKISGGAGVFYILHGSNDKIVEIDGYSRIPEKRQVDIKYSVDEEIGYLDFELTFGTSIKRRSPILQLYIIPLAILMTFAFAIGAVCKELKNG